MAHGYHSRSPEELREYLQNLNKRPKKRSWMQYILLANIVGVMFVMFVIIQDKGLGLGSSFKVSNKIQVSDMEAYFTKSNESTPESVTYFLFIQNSLLSENIFPKEDMQVLFTLTTEEKEECLQKSITFQTKKIIPKNTEFYTFQVDEPEIKRTESCDTFFHKVITKSFTQLFSKGNHKFTPELNLIYKNQIYRMSIPN